MTDTTALPTLGPGAQAVRLTFWFIVVLACISACGWAVSNVRRIPADSRVVVMRFGAFVREQDAGLLIAWPRPFETVLMVPGTARVLEQPIQSLMRDARASAADQANASTGGADGGASLSDALAGSGFVLTGDDSVVQLNATLYYRVVEPYAYVLQAGRLQSLLDRMLSAAAVEVAATRDLDAILVARPELLSAEQSMAAKREQLRVDIARVMQEHLNALDASHAGLGIEVARVDIQASFPAAAIDAFNSVLTSMQSAEEDIADARTSAETIRQGAQQSADQILQSAQANAVERVSTAQSETSTIQQLEAPLDANSDPSLLARVYRDRIQRILSKTAPVLTIDPHDASNLILPGMAR
jgi:regulator of protease activity HflC (stomatin/prohibitin superfamily)